MCPACAFMYDTCCAQDTCPAPKGWDADGNEKICNKQLVPFDWRAKAEGHRRRYAEWREKRKAKQ